MRARTLMVQGTASHVGKSVITTALCRLLYRHGYRVAPFKAQNMSLNSAVAADGEMGRSQAFQAAACGIAPETAMNPILLKPLGAGRCQVIVRGRAVAITEGYVSPDHTRRALEIAAKALNELRARFDLIVIEGMGSPVEINLRDRDGANMPIAALADAPVLLVGDIERGGVFAALAGTMELLSAVDRRRVRGLLINKFHGDPSVLRPGLEELEARYGVPTLGILPWLRDLHVDEEDAVALSAGAAREPADPEIEVVVPRFPGISNFTDLAPLEQEPGVWVRYVDRAADWGTPELVVLPGSRTVAADLLWLREQGLAARVLDHASAGGWVVGLCGGYQMLGARISDPHGIEGGEQVAGLGLLPVETTLAAEKTLDRVQGECLLPGLKGLRIDGYEIHHGETRVSHDLASVVRITSGQGGVLPRMDGATTADGRVLGTYLHGFFDAPDLRRAFLRQLGWSEGDAATTSLDVYDRLADWLEAHVNVPALLALVEEGAPTVLPNGDG